MSKVNVLLALSFGAPVGLRTQTSLKPKDILSSLSILLHGFPLARSLDVMTDLGKPAECGWKPCIHLRALCKAAGDQ